jgi:capsular exopolysaccharide synthesis family protein
VDPIEYLKTIRRRWLVVAIALLLGTTISVFALPGADGAGSPAAQYKATTILLSDQTTVVDPRVNGGLSTVAALVTIGDVPKRAAEALDFQGEPDLLALTVRASVNRTTGLLHISATAPDPTRAELVADTFAEELISYIEERNGQLVEQEAREFRRQVRRLQREIEALDQLIVSAPVTEAESLKVQRDAKALEAQNLVVAFQQSMGRPRASAGLEVIQPAIAHPELPASGASLQPPASPLTRLLIGAVLGLLAGVGLAFFLERFDRRIMTREVAERSFQAPVLAEIPRVPRDARSTLLQLKAPKSLANEAFRLLGMSLASGLPGDVQRPSGNGSLKGKGARTILVTSPGPDEGKSTVVANVAASLAELGKKVLIISCDFRAPDVHRLFDIQDGEGLGEALLSPNGGPVLPGYIHGTAVQGVFLVPSGARSERPIELLTSQNMRRALEEARRSADIVLLDTPPILMVSDAANLISEADAVLLVARARKTTTDTAKRTRELLHRLQVPAVGVALNASTEGPPGYGSTRWSRLLRGFPSLARH